MGGHMREFRFAEPVVLRKVQVLNRGERPHPGSSFEGKTFPNVRTMSLSVYAVDRTAAGSTMPRLPEGNLPGTFVAGDNFITDCVVIRGEYMKLSVVIYGHRIEAAEKSSDIDHGIAALPLHLRPVAAFDADRLDLADSEEGCADGVPDGPEVAALEAGGPTSLARALGLSTPSDASTRVMQHAAWVASLPEEPDALEAEVVVARLEALTRDLTALAEGVPDASAAHVSHGPSLARALLALSHRCSERLEFRPLHATLRALSAALCVAPTVAEVLKRGGLARLLLIIRDNEWCQLRDKLAALQALLQLCSHAVGMEAFLGWSSTVESSTGVTSKPSAASLPDHVTGYELIVGLTLDLEPGQLQLEGIALTLLRRASFYMALARLDSGCARLAAPEDGSGEAAGEELLREAIEALTDVALQLEELSIAKAAAEASRPSVQFGAPPARRGSLLDESCPSIAADDGALGSGGDPLAQAYPQLRGFLESFIAGRRLVPNLCLLLRRLPRLSPGDRLAVFSPLRRLVCTLLACVGGAQFLASDAALTTLLSLLDAGHGAGASLGGDKASQADSSRLPPIPFFPEVLMHCAIGAPQLAALCAMHVRASRLVLALVARTRLKGNDGLLSEQEALPLLAALHLMCAQGSAGRGSVVCAFRSTFLLEWLLRQLDGRLEEAVAASSTQTAPQPQSSVRHLVAILHVLVVCDGTASVAEKLGPRVLILASQTLEFLEGGANNADSADGGGWVRPSSSLEFALDSDGAEGGLGRAVRIGRRCADVACLVKLREVIAQLRPWQQTEGEPPAPSGGEPPSTLKLLACLQLSKAPRSLKRSVSEERGSRLPLRLGGYAGVDVGVEVAEVDFAGEEPAEEPKGGQALVDERVPSGSLAELPLVAMRLLRRRAAGGALEALGIVHAVGKADGNAARDGIAVLVPVLIRCAGALGLNLEARAVQPALEPIDEVYSAQQAHAWLLDAALQTCMHMLVGLSEAGVSQYRHTELLHALFLLADRLTSNLAGVAPGAGKHDPEFRLLWRHCLVWVCRVFRVWVQNFAAFSGGQLLQPLLRHARVLPSHFLPGLLLLATCGSLSPLLPASPHVFSIAPGKQTGDSPAGEQTLSSVPLFLPVSTRGGVVGHITLKVTSGEKETSLGRMRLCGQIWGVDAEAQDYELSEVASAGAFQAASDPLIRALGRRHETAVVASALGLVGRVNARREQLRLDDLGEVAALITQCAVTSNALFHLVVVRALEKLTRIGLPVLEMVLRLGDAALGGRGALETEPSADGMLTWASAVAADPVAGAVKDPRDARAVSRILMLLRHLGERSVAARRSLVEHRAEALCLSVLARSLSSLPSSCVMQAIRVLELMFCHQLGTTAPGEGTGEVEGSGGTTDVPVMSVHKCRMVSKALSLLLNRGPEDGQGSVGPAAVAAALGLLARLSSARSLCLNLLFSVGEAEDDASVWVPVTVSCAFRLPLCCQRLARELSAADECWEATTRGSEEESEAEELLIAWLQVGELLIGLCQTVLVNCPTASVFLAVILPGGTPPETVDDRLVQAVLADVNEALGRIISRKRAEMVPLRAAALLGNLRALQVQLVDMQPGPPPTKLAREELRPPRLAAETSSGDASDGIDCNAEVMADIVSLLDEAAELENSPDWLAADEMDLADPATEASGQAWEFDAMAHRKKRQAALEKLESERKAKRLKSQQDRGPRRRTSDGRVGDGDRDSKVQATTSTASGTAASATTPSGTSTSSPAPGGAASQETPAATRASATGAVPEAPPASKAAAKAPAVPKSAPPPEEAFRAFVKDHPEFMRVLQNPTKCLGDPRVKAMFMNELEKYPVVKEFLKTRGLKL